MYPLWCRCYKNNKTLPNEIAALIRCSSSREFVRVPFDTVLVYLWQTRLLSKHMYGIEEKKLYKAQTDTQLDFAHGNRAEQESGNHERHSVFQKKKKGSNLLSRWNEIETSPPDDNGMLPNLTYANLVAYFSLMKKRYNVYHLHSFPPRVCLWSLEQYGGKTW